MVRREKSSRVSLSLGNYAIAIKILTEYYGDEDRYIRLLYGNLHQNYGMA
jgi:hypothetical protein